MIDQYLAILAMAVFLGLPFLLLLAAVVKITVATLSVTSEPDVVFVQTHWLRVPPVNTIKVMVDEDGNILCERGPGGEIFQLDHVDNVCPEFLTPMGEK
jgi:hypothetical protein